MAGEQDGPGGRWRPSIDSRWILLGFLAVAGFFLFTEHRAHLLGFLPFGLLLLCPLMHMFHGHGHGNHGDRGQKDEAVPDQHEGNRHQHEGNKQ